jgi:hypothetical protein
MLCFLKFNLNLYILQMAAICLPVPSGSNNSTFDFVNFYLYDDVTGLPFPLNLHPILSLIYLIYLVFIMVEGTRLRLKIIAFINSPESNIGPINFLIWLDQANTKILMFVQENLTWCYVILSTCRFATHLKNLA